MLSRLKFFANVGQFDSVTEGAAHPLKELTVVYAENGRGKTTLSAIFRSLATNDPLPINERRRLGATGQPHIVIEHTGGPPPAIFQNGAWNGRLAEIVIFDDEFVDQNICSGLSIASDHRQNLHEFILGAQGVALNQALQGHIANIETLTRSLRELGNAIPEAARFGVPVEAFCTLPANPQIDDAIRNAERALAAAGQQDAIRTAKNFEPYVLPVVEEDSLRTLLQRSLGGLDQTASARVQAHFAAIGRGGESWVADGVERVQGGIDDPLGKACPFCAQDLGGSSLVGHYRSYFATSYAEHKAKIEHVAQQFNSENSHDSQIYFARVVRLMFERRGFWSQFLEIPNIEIDSDGISTAWTDMREAVNVALQTKCGAPLDLIELSADAVRAIETYKQKAGEFAQLTQRLQTMNAAIELVKERAASANVAALESDLQRLRATKSRHVPAIAPLCDDYLVERANKTAAEVARDAARSALDNYRTAIFPRMAKKPKL